MKKLLSGVCAASLALTITVGGLLPSHAGTIFASQPASSPSDVINVQSNDEVRKLHRRAVKDYRDGRRADRRDGNRRDRREVHRENNDGGYYQGHRGYRDYRPGYKRHGDYWYPAAAFAAGALITGVIANSQRREVVVNRNAGGSHEEWCANRYRSYRAYDDTFQPTNGPRRECISPFS